MLASGLERPCFAEIGHFSKQRRAMAKQPAAPSDPTSADQQLDNELRKQQRKAEVQMSEAAERHDENRTLGAECVSMESSIQSLESDGAGSLQRILELEKGTTPLSPRLHLCMEG